MKSPKVSGRIATVVVLVVAVAIAAFAYSQMRPPAAGPSIRPTETPMQRAQSMNQMFQKVKMGQVTRQQMTGSQH